MGFTGKGRKLLFVSVEGVGRQAPRRQIRARLGRLKQVTGMQGFGGLDNCSICGAEVEEHGERMRSIDDVTYIFCSRCSKHKREKISRMLGLDG
jgi:DNA-directed RNA polymerase subunit RPC12/RpoP